MQMIGALLVSFVLGYLAILIAQLRHQYVNARRQDELSAQLLRTQIEAVSLLKRQREETRLSWNGYRDFQVHGTVSEAKNITSLYLFPHDGKPLPEFQPGQSLTLRLLLPGAEEPIERRFAISSAPSPDFYRITVQKTAGDPVSDYLHKEVNQHTILKVGAPRGEFCIDPTLFRPMAMIADGVGVAPFVSMIESVIQTNSRRSITLIHSVQNKDEHAMCHHLKTLESQHQNLRIITVFQDAGPSDCCGHTGPVTIDLLRSQFLSTNFEFYVCGPDEMVKTMRTSLRRWGVSRWNLTTEIIESLSAAAATETRAAADRRLPVAASPTSEPDSVVSAIRNAMKAATSNPAARTATATAVALAPAAGSLT